MKTTSWYLSFMLDYLQGQKDWWVSTIVSDGFPCLYTDFTPNLFSIQISSKNFLFEYSRGYVHSTFVFSWQEVRVIQLFVLWSSKECPYCTTLVWITNVQQVLWHENGRETRKIDGTKKEHLWSSSWFAVSQKISSPSLCVPCGQICL